MTTKGLSENIMLYEALFIHFVIKYITLFVGINGHDLRVS